MRALTRYEATAFAEELDAKWDEYFDAGKLHMAKRLGEAERWVNMMVNHTTPGSMIKLSEAVEVAAFDAYLIGSKGTSKLLGL